MTQEDYTISSQYRETLYERFLITTSSSDLLIIGYSLSDPDLMEIIDEAVRRKRTSFSPGRIYVLAYKPDENRALLLEQRGLRVAFGGLDDFVAALDRNASSTLTSVATDDILSFFPHLRPTTVDIPHAATLGNTDVTRMFYGSPPTYSDITNDLTFERDALALMRNYFEVDDALAVYVLGVAGVGKTTLCRQFLINAFRTGSHAWEHVEGTDLKSSLWASLAERLKTSGERGYLYVDNAHKYIREINELVDLLSASSNRCLKIVISTTLEQWSYRTKSPNLFVFGKRIDIRRLSRSEIQRLLDLFDFNSSISSLVEKEFSGFSRQERQRRLEQKCEADFFVCLKNIFSNELLDEIVLKEFAGLRKNYQEIYKTLSALEASGLKLHRQMIIRMLGIPMGDISDILNDLDGMVVENTVNKSLGIYAWSGRHIVISEIIMKSKFSAESEIADLYDKFVDLVNPTFDIERLNLMELCARRGLGRLASRDRQNSILAKIISKAPTLRVPRHRLIDNLIRMGRYERAANEIRIFESDMRADAPLLRFKINLSLERARHSAGLMTEDRITLVRNAATMSRKSLERFPDDTSLHEIYCDSGIQFMRLSGDWSVADDAIKLFHDHSADSLDPEFSRAYAKYQLKFQQIQAGT
nr:SIR2 family protein [Aminobacter sp. AP02]